MNNTQTKPAAKVSQAKNKHAEGNCVRVNEIREEFKRLYLIDKLTERNLDNAIDACKKYSAKLAEKAKWIATEYHLGEDLFVEDLQEKLLYNIKPTIFNMKFPKKGWKEFEAKILKYYNDAERLELQKKYYKTYFARGRRSGKFLKFISKFNFPKDYKKIEAEADELIRTGKAEDYLAK